MQFTFLDMAGKTLFIRGDAERATWTQEEMSLSLEFPYLSDKAISTGQRVFFKDPSTGSHQIYEIKQAQTREPDHYQVIMAEHICISELSDDFIESSEITNKTAQSALQTVLNGTLWSVGNVATNPTSSADLSRGSVWQGILEIGDNWNVYIEPRVTLSSNGTIARKLDIVSTAGAWNGIRLSVNKNMLDPSVTYDDSEVVTAMYGFGGIDPEDDSDDKKEITFADVEWAKTDSHPAKPKGQTYLEDKTATSLYGRNGKARFGYYQNNEILDPNVLLQKTWASLKTQNKPKISIEGTVADLYRLGYADQPIRLHDIAQVEVLPVGFKERIQIIRMTTDLLDPSETTVTIGAYIPNIIYIERRTNQNATGRRGGGGGNRAEDTNAWQEFRTTMINYADGTGMQIKAVQNDNKRQDQEIEVQSGRIEVLYNQITLEVQDRREADNVLSGKITVEAGKISQIVSAVGSDGKVTAASIVAAVNGGASSIKLKADHIDIDGLITKLESKKLSVGSLHVEGSSDFLRRAYFEAGIQSESTVWCEGLDAGTGGVSGASASFRGNVSGATGKFSGNVTAGTLNTSSLKVGSYNATWQSLSFKNITALSDYHSFIYGSTSTPSGVASGRIVAAYTDTTIYYLGR